MSIGTKSVLFGAHCWFLHPFFLAKAWRVLYGPARGFRLWASFFVHDLGYLGKENLDGPEGEEHVQLGARIMRWIGGQQWEEFTACHSRFWAKKHGLAFSRLCVADKLAFVLTPIWLYRPMARWTGELWEYMSNNRNQLADLHNLEAWEAHCLRSSAEIAFLEGLRSYVRRWVETHRDLTVDDWTVPRRQEISSEEVERELPVRS
jgi:hypothetical protein